MSLFLDLDLAILSSDPANYALQCGDSRGIRWVEEAQYLAVRSKVLQSFLEDPCCISQNFTEALQQA